MSPTCQGKKQFMDSVKILTWVVFVFQNAMLPYTTGSQPSGIGEVIFRNHNAY